MRYYLIDRVVYLEYDRRISAIKSVALSEDVFSDHFYGNPVMPGALQIESLAQAGTVLLEVSSQFRSKAVLALINTAKFRALVRPGDQLQIELGILSSDGQLVQTEGIIKVGEQVVTSARLTFSLQPIDDYYPPEARHLTDMLYKNFLRGATIVGGPDPRTEHG
jgi:3-hydroxyacyl-[acyl-carrier-protein] dehydratase